MKFHAARIFLFFLLTILSFKASAHVALDYPQGGETFIQGQTVTITWHIVAFHATLNWDLYFSSNSGDTWEPILLNIPYDSLSHT